MVFRPSVLAENWTYMHRLFPRWTSYSNHNVTNIPLPALGTINYPSTSYTRQDNSLHSTYFLPNKATAVKSNTTAALLDGIVSFFEEINLNLTEEQYSLGVDASTYEIPAIYILPAEETVSTVEIKTDSGWTNVNQKTSFKDAMFEPEWAWIQEDDLVALVNIGIVEETCASGWVTLDTSNWSKVGPVWYREPNLEKWNIIPPSQVRADGLIYKYSSTPVKVRYYKTNFQAITPVLDVKINDKIVQANITHLWTKVDELAEIALDSPRREFESTYYTRARISNWISYSGVTKRKAQAGISAALGLGSTDAATGSPVISFQSNEVDIIPAINRFWYDRDKLYPFGNYHRLTVIPDDLKAVDVLDPLVVSGENILGVDYSTAAMTFGSNYTVSTTGLVVNRHFQDNLNYFRVRGVKYASKTKKRESRWTRVDEEQFVATSSSFI